MKDSTQIRYTLLVILKLLLLFIVWGCNQHVYTTGVMQLPFKTISHIPLIEGKLNGKHAYFIIDTGASCSILNESVSEHFGFRFISNNDQSVQGLSGEARTNKAINCLIEVGPLKINNIFRSQRMCKLVSVIKEYDNVEVAGIIGSDVFRRYRITIDYKNNMITF